MSKKFPLSLLIWTLKKYSIVSLAGLVVYSLLLWFITKTIIPSIPKEFLFYFIILLLLLGFILSLSIGVLTIFSYLKPLSLMIQKIEHIAHISSLDNTPKKQNSFLKNIQKHHTPGDFYELNKNLDLIYKNIKQTSVHLTHEKAELEAIAAAVSDAIIAIDSHKKIIFSNPQSKNLFPMVEPQASIQDVISNKEVLENLEKCLTSGSTFNRDLTLNIGEYKAPRIFEVSISPLVHIQSQLNGAVIVFFDKTEIKNTERSHIDFVSNVSHELKTPLTSIKGFLETMQTDLEEKKYDQIHNFLNIVSKNVARLMDLIDDLLSLSHIDSISLLDKQEVNTREITAVACETIPMDKHRVNYIYKADTVSASRQWLEQVLYNLVHNAVKYTPPGSTIDVIWEKHPHFILLTVKDNGEGIPLRHQHRIFERFYRVEEDRSREKGGTGIGLAIVKQVMEKHGGHVYLTSRRRGKGAKLTCTFPR
ncbi:MAG: ATP-binding protein [Bdellovibrionales bacterium]|nr:ATP-binding protein [Bdellovibrionales bacterium]